MITSGYRRDIIKQYFILIVNWEEIRRPYGATGFLLLH